MYQDKANLSGPLHGNGESAAGFLQGCLIW